MPTFDNIRDLEKYVQDNLVQVARNSPDLQRALERAMRNSIISEVYGAYTPEKYQRRKKGGLSDPSNFHITGVDVVGNSILVRYENLTTGADNLSGKYIIDLIEGGEGASGMHWEDPSGEWANPRRAVEHAIEQLRSNPNGLKRAIRKSLSELGFTVR